MVSNLSYRYHYSARLVRGGAYSMYAIIKTGGKQYTVREGDVLRIESSMPRRVQIYPSMRFWL